MIRRSQRLFRKPKKIVEIENVKKTSKEKGKGVVTINIPDSPLTERSKSLEEEKKSQTVKGFDGYRFRDSKATQDYENKFKHRGVIRDRALVLEEENCSDHTVKAAMLARGWQFFNENLGNGYQELTREFYANLRANSIEDKFPFSSFLRGVTIPLSGHILNKLLKVPILDEEGCHYTWKVDIFHRAKNENLRKEILEECCEQGATYITKVNGAPKSVRKGCLNHFPLLWCHYVLSSLQPMAHATEIAIKRLVMKKMQLGTYDLVMNHDLMLRKIATALKVDHTEEIGVLHDIDLWLASTGFIIPPDDTPLATKFPHHPEQDNDDPMDEESKEEDD
ncbi:hypothetical protein RJT34_12638 [Clitoria ternatea]|uniref:Putative plant transposon protein domain-containing protein n=1 Tax=Clitoria ternatea TaxID=43366 RepID=A0AAN9JQP1_CLITE